MVFDIQYYTKSKIILQFANCWNKKGQEGKIFSIIGQAFPIFTEPVLVKTGIHLFLSLRILIHQCAIISSCILYFLPRISFPRYNYPLLLYACILYLGFIFSLLNTKYQRLNTKSILHLVICILLGILFLCLQLASRNLHLFFLHFFNPVFCGFNR